MASATQFIDGATISYPCWGYEGGNVIAKWDAYAEAWGTALTASMLEGEGRDRRWVKRTRPIEDADFEWEKMSVAQARLRFPTDASVVQ